VKIILSYVGEVSTIFDFFLSRFVQQLVLTFSLVGLDAEFNSLSNGTSFNRGCLTNTKVFLKMLNFLTFLLTVNSARIRLGTCVDFLVDCIEYRIQFSIEWCQFQLTLIRGKKVLQLTKEFLSRVEIFLFWAKYVGTDTIR
jgi:hypothetical protein